MRSQRLTKKGAALVAAAVTSIGFAVGRMTADEPLLRPTRDLVIDWDYLEGHDGSDLMRLETPKGWVVENADGYLLFIPDESKEWLSNQSTPTFLSGSGTTGY